MENGSILIEVMGDHPTTRIIDVMIENIGKEMTQKEICEEANISRPTLYQHLPKLVNVGIIRISRKIGNNNMYLWDTKNSIAKHILKMETEMISKELDDAKTKKTFEVQD